MRLVHIAIVLLLGHLCSCSQRKTVKDYNNVQTTIAGDLYFKVINIDSLYAVDSLMLKKIKSSLDSLKSINENDLSKRDKETISAIEKLNIKELVEKNSFHIKDDSLTEYLVYVNHSDWDKIGGYERTPLLNHNKKIRIELTGEIIFFANLRIINCEKINKVEKLTDKTLEGVNASQQRL